MPMDKNQNMSKPANGPPGNRKAGTPSRRFTLWGFFGPMGTVGIGVLAGVLAPHSESDWFGSSLRRIVGLSLIAASLQAIVCSVLAFSGREQDAFLTTLTAIPGFVFLVWLLATTMHL